MSRALGGGIATRAAHLATLAVIVLIPAACGPAPAANSQGSGTSQAFTSSASASAGSDPETLLGIFDLDEYENLYDTTFTTANVTDSEAIRYVADFAYPVTVEVMVESPESDVIIQSSFGFDLSEDRSDAERAAQETWFLVTAEHQPEAVGWLEEHLTDYLAAPGAEMSFRESFGETCAGFFTLDRSSFDPDPDPFDPNFGKATLVGFFVEDASVNGC